tara:strand:+ start:1466 stop:1864 length:399 start_codon:yes stop_codon:yes gene_type:complete
MKYFLILVFYFFFSSNVLSNDPYDNDLAGKKLICFVKSESIEDWGMKFLPDNEVILYSMNKLLYEIYKYKRTYRTDLRNIKIINNKDIEFVINRSTLKFRNKKCTLADIEPFILLQRRIDEIKQEKTKKNKI